jgi:hypothetical protein
MHPARFELLLERDIISRGASLRRSHVEGENDLEIRIEVVTNPDVAALVVVLIDLHALELAEGLRELEPGLRVHPCTGGGYLTDPGSHGGRTRARG